MEPAPARALREAIDHGDRLVREWRMARLRGLGIPWPLARDLGAVLARRPAVTLVDDLGTITRQLTIRTSYIPARPAHQEV
jgi:hypothetical protein